ncbi:YqaA family protein, partial [Klebsiella pneumoniae]|uniref:YqaA family protein n=1 Tax=Klebsiella pneumoniae TaxID=573 RepID=UPI00217ED911
RTVRNAGQPCRPVARLCITLPSDRRVQKNLTTTVLIATIGNSLGGVTNVILGRLFPLRKTSRWQERAAGWLKRYGAVTLLLSWAPVVGDLLCLLAGWMRISWGPVLFFLCLGKALRYIAIAAATLQGMTWWH